MPTPIPPTPITHRIELYRSDWIDWYNVSIDDDPWQQKIQELEARVKRLQQEKSILKKATVDSNGHCNRSLDSRISRSYALIDQLSEQQPVELVCAAFGINRSCFYSYRQRRARINTNRLRLRAKWARYLLVVEALPAVARSWE